MNKFKQFPNKNIYDMAYDKAYDILIELGIVEDSDLFQKQLDFLTNYLYIHISYLLTINNIEIDVVI
jgi:hypothetical protein